MKTNSNGKKVLSNGKEQSISFADLYSGLQNFIAHRAPHPDGLSDAEVKAFWSEVKFQNSDRDLNLSMDVGTMRRLMAAGVAQRRREIKQGRLIAGKTR